MIPILSTVLYLTAVRMEMAFSWGGHTIYSRPSYESMLYSKWYGYRSGSWRIS